MSAAVNLTPTRRRILVALAEGKRIEWAGVPGRGNQDLMRIPGEGRPLIRAYVMDSLIAGGLLIPTPDRKHLTITPAGLDAVGARLCPRCEVNRLNPNEQANALSRRDGETRICSPCGQEEGAIDRAGVGTSNSRLALPDEWVGREAVFCAKLNAYIVAPGRRMYGTFYRYHLVARLPGVVYSPGVTYAALCGVKVLGSYFTRLTDRGPKPNCPGCRRERARRESK